MRADSWPRIFTDKNQDQKELSGEIRENPWLSRLRFSEALLLGKTKQLKCDSVDEFWIVYQVPPPQSRRILVNAVHPLNTRDLHPIRCIFDAAGMNVESRAHTEHQLGVELGEVLVHEPLLLRSTQAYPEEIRLGFRNHPDQSGFLLSV